MGYAIFLIYLALSYIRLPELNPTLVRYHFMMVLGIMGTFFASFGFALNTIVVFQVQTFLIIGFMLIIGISQVMTGYFGGGIQAIEHFSITFAMYMMIVGNVKTIKHLRSIIGLTVILSCTLVGIGVLAVYQGFLGESFVMSEGIYVGDDFTGEYLKRMRALGSLNDPNDLAQVLIVAVVLLGIWWKPNGRVRNMVLLIPAAWLVYGVYLTHSRGALFGLFVAALLLMQTKFGKAGSLLVSGALVFALVAANFSGGRVVSSGEESAQARMKFWAAGLEMLKADPVFGVGYRNYPDENDGRAAHNSFIQCAAELGMTGYLVWLAILVATITGLTVIQKTPAQDAKDGEIPLQTYARCLRIALYTYLVTGWFLSRAYTETLFMLIGMGVVVIGLARQRGLYKQHLFLGNLAVRSASIAVGTLLLLKVMIRLR